ncbi:ABC transporter permease [Agromyces laixinhei]|uniref:ABC transporter permease n=1 Tax=Agromyces laixinhei TaxID=2585717 RepID=UPI0012ED9FF5|nr:ABC transporter permease [Agromyces laixinhei]
MSAADALATDSRSWRRSFDGVSVGITGIFAWLPISIIALFLFAALLGPVLVDYNPVTTHLSDRLLSPGAMRSTGEVALLGTDATGRDVFAQVLYGARTSMMIGAITVSVSCMVGMLVGLVAGYLGGFVDGVLSRIIDVLVAFPGIVLAIVIAGLFDRSILVVIIALSVTGWVSFARLTRGATLSIKEREWVSAARIMGVPRMRIMGRHVLPFLVGPAAALITLEFGLIVLGEAGLSFLGIGLPVSTVSWGQTIASGKEYLATAWWISAFPGAALALLVVMIGLLGDQLNARYQKGAAL